MGLFDLFKKNDNIRCDEKDFLIWKWRPAGQAMNTATIRKGSNISVRPGQAAVFLYQQKEGEYDIIKGPYQGTLEMQHMPILSSFGSAPAQADVYYFNLAKNMEIPFTIPYFRVIPGEKEYAAYDIEVAIKGAIAFEVSSQKEYIKYLFEAWGGNDTSLEELERKLKSLLTQEVKQIVASAPKEKGIFVLHFNSLIGELGQYIQARLEEKIARRFGVLVNDITISDIRFDDETDSYQKLKRVTETQSHLFNLEKEKTALLEFEIRRENMRQIAKAQSAPPSSMAAGMRSNSNILIPQRK